MIFRLATSVLEKRRESISVDGVPAAPHWNSLKNLRAKIKQTAAEAIEAKRVEARGRLQKKTVTPRDVEEQEPITSFLDLTHQKRGLSVEETLDIDEGEEGHDRHGINLSVVQMKMLEDGKHNFCSQLPHSELRNLIRAARDKFVSSQSPW